MRESIVAREQSPEHDIRGRNQLERLVPLAGFLGAMAALMLIYFGRT